MDISIICLTYNHKKYIRETLDGFFMQKGEVEYEVLVHDDASLDGTIEILKEYKGKYPDKVTLILQKENQYPKGIKKILKRMYSLAKGKYLAVCEGDDFWVYDHKLQKQFELMEKNPNIALCYHNALVYQEESDTLKLNVNGQPSGYIEDGDIINVKRGWYPTASIFCRTEYMREMPDFCASTDDEVCRTYMACRGDLYYINRVWSVYREFTDGGWNTRYYQNKELALNHFRDTVKYFSDFNRYSNGRFQEHIKERIFLGIHKFRDAHYGMDCPKDELRRCLNELRNVTRHVLDAVFDEYYEIYVINCKDYYRATVEECLKNEEGLYLYGTGVEALKALAELDRYHMRPRGFIISESRKSPSTLLGIPICGIDECTANEDKMIWPCLINGREEVLKLLHLRKYKRIVL